MRLLILNKQHLVHKAFELMSAGGLGACFLEGFGDMLPRKILTGMSSKMAKNASKYVRRNTWRYY